MAKQLAPGRHHLYNCTTAIAMACQGRQDRIKERLRLSQLVMATACRATRCTERGRRGAEVAAVNRLGIPHLGGLSPLRERESGGGPIGRRCPFYAPLALSASGRG